jgi:hypothetical protein
MGITFLIIVVEVPEDARETLRGRARSAATLSRVRAPQPLCTTTGARRNTILCARPLLPALLASFVMLFGPSGCSYQAIPASTAGPGRFLSDNRHAPDDMTVTAGADNTVNVKFMLRGYCHAGSTIKDDQALGGFGRSDNMPKKIWFDKQKSSSCCYLLAQPEVVTEFGGGKGMRLVLANATRNAIAFNACDSRLYIIQEAKDESGNWRPIEYLPSSWCGNSYHRVILGPGEFWSFPSPRYEGSFPTILRFHLVEQGGRSIAVSNEFEGSINPEQFSVRQPYNPGNIMDPYFPVPADGGGAGGQVKDSV